jgi:AAA family ATP:ADP antiporter
MERAGTPQLDRTARLFLLASALMLAHQVAGQAVRDGLFLSRFSPGDLPRITAAAALLALVLGLGFSRVLARFGPLRAVPAAFAAGSLLHLVEYGLLSVAGPVARAIVISAVYLHLVGFGAILLSGFWSVVNEVLDPREAKTRFGRITGAGTFGGIVGGLMAERGAAWFGVDSLLLLLAGLHMAAALVVWRAPDRDAALAPPAGAEPVWHAARDAFRQAPFLVNLAVLVVLGTMSAALLDYLFKSTAAATYGRGPSLTRYFALFYTANQVLGFAVQTLATPVALKRLGLGRTVVWHPAAVAFGSGASMIVPLWISAPVARSLELILRGSFLRSGYELFFTPVPPREKRAVKTFIDVGCDRLGDALGAALLQCLLVWASRQAVMLILAAALVFAVIGIWITVRMDAAYAKVLEHGLLSRAVALNEGEVHDSTTLSVLVRTSNFRAPLERQPPPQPPPPARHADDPVLARLADLRSRDAGRVQAALAVDQPFDAALVPPAIRLLAWDEAFEWARAFLLLHAHRAVGQLVDALLDTDQDFAVRRRIPHLLAYTSSQRAVDGLMLALDDPRFEIRFNSSRALDFLHRMSDGLRFDAAPVMRAVERELSISRSVWEGRRLLDPRDQNDSQYWFLDEVLRDRADKSLEHVFSLLAVTLPVEPLKVAFRALHSEDRLLRGLALEYLESHLSANMVAQLRALADPAPAAPAARPAQEVLDELMASHESILVNLKIASAGARG